MIDKRYYEGYEGEFATKIWTVHNGVEYGLVVWRGFFEAILEGCFTTGFMQNGIVECYYNQDGFCDDKWEMRYPMVVLRELAEFDEKRLSSFDEEIVRKAKELVGHLIAVINSANKYKQTIYIEYI